MIAIATAAVCMLMVALPVFGVVQSGTRALDTARGAIAVLADDAMDEAARERAVRRASLSLLGSTASILGRSILALAVAAVPILSADWAGMVPIAESIRFLARWDVIAVVSLATTAACLTLVKLWPFK